MAVAERTFLAMGGAAHVVVTGRDADLHASVAEKLIARLEALWSRFRPDSEVSRLNAAAGSPVLVSPETFALVEQAIDAWRWSGGRFDPTVLASLCASGYDRSHEEVVATRRPARSPITAPGCQGIELDAVLEAITLPAGVGFDPGGLGKGLAADLASEAVMTLGADGALVNLGGDLRALGGSENAPGWIVAVESPFDPAVETARLTVRDAGIATSSRRSRSWWWGDEPAHHLLDPSTGRPHDGAVVSVTVVARDAAWAEVVAKSAFGFDAEGALGEIERAGAEGLVIDDHGQRHATAGFEEWCS